MTPNKPNSHVHPASAGIDQSVDTQSPKSVWEEPNLVRLDASLTQTVFNVVPDGDTVS